MINHKLLSTLLNQDIEPENKPLLIHASSDNYPLVDFVLHQLRAKISHYHKQYFTAERFFDFATIEAMSNNASLFEQPNYIQINFKTKPDSKQGKGLLKLLGTLQPQDFLVIVCDKLNKTDQNTSWFSAFADRVLFLSNVDAEFLVSYRLGQYNLQSTNEAMVQLIKQNQGNLASLLNEAHLLSIAATPGDIIDITTVAKLTNNNAQHNIYQLSTAYLSGNLAESIRILDNLYHENSDAILIMWVLLEDTKRLLKIKSKLKTGASMRQIIQEMGLWGASVNELPKALKRLNYKTLIEIYELLAQLDMAIKGVLNLAPRLLLVTIITRMCDVPFHHKI